MRAVAAPRPLADDLRKPYPLRRKLGLAAEIIGTYVRVRWWLLRRRDVREIVALLRTVRESSPGADPQDVTDIKVGLRLGRVIWRTLTPLPADSRCLVRSLVLTGLLARRGIDSTLVIGVRPDPEFEAHAWVERRGFPLLPTRDGERVFERLTEI